MIKLQESIANQDEAHVRCQNNKVLSVIDGMIDGQSESEFETSYDGSDSDATFQYPEMYYI